MNDLRLQRFAWWEQAFQMEAAERERILRDQLVTATSVMFERSTSCFAGERADGRLEPCQLRASTSVHAKRTQLGLTGRTQRVVSRALARAAARAWAHGSIHTHHHAAWIPADCWTERIFAEAGRRLYMDLCAGSADRLPAFDLPNRWPLPPGRDGAVPQLRAHAEDSAFEDWRLSAKGIVQFASFGRDPAVPLP